MPTLRLGRKIGSCKYDDVCAEFKPKSVCPPPLGPAGIPCACPIPAGAYSLPPTVVSTAVGLLYKLKSVEVSAASGSRKSLL